MGAGQKIAASFSGGKDGALALYRAVQVGLQPVSLVTTYNTDAGRSWFHGIPEEMLQQIARLMGLPMAIARVGPGDDYAAGLELALASLRDVGAEACVFGDIDIQDHRDWCTERCRNAGIEAIFPLWNEPRADLVYELIDAGFKATITIVDTQHLDERYLGQTLDRKLAAQIAADGADICGENGEYHSLITDGPLLSAPLPHRFGQIVRQGNYAILPVQAQP